MFFLSGGNLFLEKNQLHGRVAGSMAGHGGAEDDISPEQCTNVFRTGPVIEPEKLPVHRSDRRSNRYRTGDVINIYFIILYIIKN